jgi:bifunctional UDP-N-acetylglucosamine pyrophosphorylase/glucosamine-1-phosphate N-acetyltransferase
MKDSAVIVLAAGQGTRMKSAIPKVLHAVKGRPLIGFPLELATRLGCRRTVVVVGHGREAVEEAVRRRAGGGKVSFAVQERQLGTGHAVIAALPALKGHDGPVLVLSGDVPLLEPGSIRRLRKAYDRAGGPVAFLSFTPREAGGYGRVVREGKAVVAIREARDCSAAQLRIGEVNAGIYLIDAAFLRRSVRKLGSSNAQGELYLTDLVAMAARRHTVAAVPAPEEEVGGVNDRVDLARVEAVLQARTNASLMRSGVTMRQPETVSVDLDSAIGPDTELGPGVQIRKGSRIGKGCIVETGSVVTDSVLEDGAVVMAYSVLDGATVGRGAQVGPMARLRPGTVLDRGSKVGNFVELKNTFLGEGSKANHLAYLGDGEIGKGVNVGAGTIFCNYDGYQKHRTVLEDDVFIGSDSQLVAPVRVGKGAYVASGSTITKDVPPDAIAIARGRQENKERTAPLLRRTLLAKKKRREQG